MWRSFCVASFALRESRTIEVLERIARDKEALHKLRQSHGALRKRGRAIGAPNFNGHGAVTVLHQQEA